MFPDYDRIILGEDDENTLQLSGWFERLDGEVLPDSTAMFLYVYNTNSPTDFIRGQGEIDSSTGNFTAAIEEIPLHSSKVSIPPTGEAVLDICSAKPSQ